MYGFGDSWDHRIKIERVLPPLGIDVPICVDGADATPPDHCGGIGGYEDFVAALRDPSQPEHEATLTVVAMAQGSKLVKLLDWPSGPVASGQAVFVTGHLGRSGAGLQDGD